MGGTGRKGSMEGRIIQALEEILAEYLIYSKYVINLI